jgi:prepilin-type N-terminal cleavage/methylation domain-containing protein
MKKGFTLVELSIVLVIIGLLIGGILVGQSLISAAKIRGQITQIQQFDIAVSGFRTKFSGMPGDVTGLGCVAGTMSVCGNGLIEMDNISSCCTFDSEEANFWPDLQKAAFFYEGKRFKSNTSGMATAPIDVSSSTPDSPRLIATNLKAGALPQNCGWNNDINCYTFVYYAPWDVDDPIVSLGFEPMLTSVNALALDSKLDDGKPYNGSVQNWITAIDSGAGFSCDDNTNYTPTSSGAQCHMQIAFFSTNGDSPK